MTDVLQGLVSEAKKNKFSTIGPSLSDEDVASVWDGVSGFIDKQMQQQKGVHIAGLGTFTFSQKKLDVGNNKFILLQRPVFLLSEKFAQTHGLHYTKHHTTGQIPVVQLNFSALSCESPYDRDTVEACVKEILSALARSVGSRQNTEFLFSGIGRLQIKDSKVKMKFYKDFVNSMDGSGRLVDALKDRPGTMDSVMSDRTPTRAYTSNTLVLPRITQGNGGLGPDMPPIEEEAPEENLTHRDDDHALHEDPDVEFEYEEKRPSPGAARSGSRMAVSMAKATGVCFVDDLMPPKELRSPHPKNSPTPKLLKRSLSPIHMTGSPKPEYERSRSVDSINLRGQDPFLTMMPTPPSKDKSWSAPSKERGDLRTGLTPPGTGSSCGHADAGQELCYLCHQRERRNIPVDFSEELRRREQEEDRLLQQYQHMKDTEATLKQQESELVKRHESQKMAAFNLGVAEAIKTKKGSRPIDFHPSYVFQRRPLTPPRFIKQQRYCGDLADQVKVKDETAKKRKADEEFLERLEQVQLAEDLAVQRNQYLKDKSDQQEQYKRALSAQIRVRDGMGSDGESRPRIRRNRCLGPLTLPSPNIILPFSESCTMRIKEDDGRVIKFKPQMYSGKGPMSPEQFYEDEDEDDDSASQEPVFGKNEFNNDKKVTRHRLANDLLREQLDIVDQRKRAAILKRLQEQQEEEEMLRRTKEMLLKDRTSYYERMYMNRKRLEEAWTKAVKQKKLHESEERMRTRSPGMLVHEQCDRFYSRCNQCKRDTCNKGESNIWKESRYIAGSRLMI